MDSGLGQAAFVTYDGDVRRAGGDETYEVRGGEHVRLAHDGPAGQALAAYRYAYETAGRLRQVDSVAARAADKAAHGHYAYGQMEGEGYSGGRPGEGYAYDSAGNRVGPDIVPGPGNRLLSDGRYDYAYDNEGRRTRRTDRASGEVTAYAWDHRDRLTSVTLRDAAGPQVERYAHDGDHVLYVFDGAGNQDSPIKPGPFPEIALWQGIPIQEFRGKDSPRSRLVVESL